MNTKAPRAPRGRTTRGFTLVEMLVVIGVISILASMVLVAVTSGTESARLAACGNNLRQIYAGARMYSNLYAGFLPDPYVNMVEENEGVWATNSAKVWGRYVQSHHVQAEPRGSEGPVTKVPAGLWLLRTTKYVDANDSFYCTALSGSRRYDGSENKATDGVPIMVGYAYNFFPHLLSGDDAILFPNDDPIPEDISNNVQEIRDLRFNALASDLFERPDEIPHRRHKAVNCIFWDGSLQLIDLANRRMSWNGKVTTDEGQEVDTFTTDKAGAEAVRDSWVLISSGRR